MMPFVLGKLSPITMPTLLNPSTTSLVSNDLVGMTF